MASMKKFTHSAVMNQIRHVLRETKNPANTNINPTRTPLNYTISPDRGMHPYSYYQNRKSELYCYGRADVKTLAGWVVTLPNSLSETLHLNFFQESYRFLESRYGQQNTVLAAVHLDESQPHLHYLFIPAAPDLKRGGFKVCANEVLSSTELRNFHPALSKYLKEVGINECVHADKPIGNDYRGISFSEERKFERLLRERKI